MADKQVDVQVLGVPVLILNLYRFAGSTGRKRDGKRAAGSLAGKAVKGGYAQIVDVDKGAGHVGCLGLFGNELPVGDVGAGVVCGSDAGIGIEETDAHQLG